MSKRGLQNLALEEIKKPLRTTRAVSKILRKQLVRPPLVNDGTKLSPIRTLILKTKIYQIGLNP